MTDTYEEITLELLQSLDIDAVIKSVEPGREREYRSLFQSQADRVDQKSTKSAWCFLSAITSMHFRPKNTKKPFGPLFVMESCRGAIPEDLPDDLLQVIAEFYPGVLDPELRARLADIAWLRLRRPEHGEAAINAYLESARNLEDPQHWVETSKRVERALRLAAQFRRNNIEPFNNVTTYIEEILDRYQGNDPMFLSIKMLELCADFTIGDNQAHLELAVLVASAARENSNWHKAEQAWSVAEKFAAQLNDDQRRQDILSQSAETHAEQARSATSGMAASRFMQQAIEVYKSVPKSRERRDELYQELRSFQQQSLDEMVTIESPEVDLTDSVRHSRDAVKGKSFEDALFNFAFRVAHPPDYDELKKQSQENAGKFIFSSIAGAVHMDRDGLVVAHVPASVGLSDDDLGKSTWADMLRTVQIHHGMDVQGAIEPARTEIIFEHHIDDGDIFPYVSRNPLVPAGHEYLYAMGIASGFNGDFITAAHLLIPQLENSFRHVLSQQGVEVTTLNTHGVQEHLRITTILEHPKFLEIFGRDNTLDLQALLIDRKYANLRNDISHGLMGTQHFNTVPVIYLWWLTIRLCLTPYLKAWSDAQPDES